MCEEESIEQESKGKGSIKILNVFIIGLQTSLKSIKSNPITSSSTSSSNFDRSSSGTKSDEKAVICKVIRKGVRKREVFCKEATIEEGNNKKESGKAVAMKLMFLNFSHNLRISCILNEHTCSNQDWSILRAKHRSVMLIIADVKQRQVRIIFNMYELLYYIHVHVWLIANDCWCMKQTIN